MSILQIHVPMLFTHMENFRSMQRMLYILQGFFSLIQRFSKIIRHFDAIIYIMLLK